MHIVINNYIKNFIGYEVILIYIFEKILHSKEWENIGIQNHNHTEHMSLEHNVKLSYVTVAD